MRSPVEFRNNEWGFWDESWSYWYGGYPDESSANFALSDYSRFMLDGKPFNIDIDLVEHLLGAVSNLLAKKGEEWRCGEGAELLDAYQAMTESKNEGS